MDNNQYQQPYRPQGEGLSGFTKLIVKLLPILTLIFVILAAVAFLYYFIISIVAAADVSRKAFSVFVTGFATGIGATAKYLFFAGITAAAEKLLKK